MRWLWLTHRLTSRHSYSLRLNIRQRSWSR
jgi:hypothetical protein